MIRSWLVILAVAIASGAAFFGRPEAAAVTGHQEEPPERQDLARLVASCRKCHENEHREWEATFHARAWTDPVFQAEIQDLPDKGESCARCHAPQELLITGLGAVPKARTVDRDLGVNCVTCHMLQNRYHGPHDSAGHGGVAADPRYRQPELCLSCHGRPEARADHDQGTSFLAARTDTAVTCQTCHMPALHRKMVTGDRVKKHQGEVECRAHDFTGARRGQIVENAATLDVGRAPDGRLRVLITPRTGHFLPASTHRKVVLEVVLTDATGAAIGRHLAEFSFPAAPLPGGKGTELFFEAPPADARIRASLVQELETVPGRGETIRQKIAEAQSP